MNKKRKAPKPPGHSGLLPEDVQDEELIVPLNPEPETSNNSAEVNWLHAVCTLLPSRRNYGTQLRPRRSDGTVKRRNPLYRSAFTLPSKPLKMDVHPHVLISLQRQLSTGSLRTRGKSSRLSRHSFRFLQKATGLGDGDSSSYVNFATQMAADEGISNLEYLTTIRSLPVSMNEKRQVRAKLLQSPETATSFSAWDQQQQRAKKRLKNLWQEVLPFLYIWKKSMKVIEGQYGMGVVSYFVFLRWLLYLNLAIFLMVFMLIVMPQLVHNAKQPKNIFGMTTDTTVATTVTTAMPYFMNERWWSTGADKINSTLKRYGSCSLINLNDSMSSYCHCMYLDGVENRTQVGVKAVLDLLQGTGFMENTALFPGWYQPRVPNYLISGNGVYNLALAYILVTVVYFLLCLMMMVVYTTESVRESFKTADGHLHKYCNMVFGGWDYCIEKQTSAFSKHQSISQELKSNLAQERRLSEIAAWSRQKLLKVYMGRVLANFLVVCILASTLYCISYVCKMALDAENEGSDSLLIQFSPSLAVTGFNILLPIVFGQIVRLENYAIDFEIKMTLIRTVFIRLASVVFLIVTFYVQVECPKDKRDMDCGYCTKSKVLRCWENYVGQQIYKLVILDFAVVVVSVFLMDFPRKLIGKHLKCKLSKFIGDQEFDIPKNVLDLVYSQTLCWLGTFYSPLLPGISLLKFFIFFYVKKLTLLVNYKPSKVPYRASRSNTFFIVVLMLSFVLSAVPVGFGIADFTPSSGCSPFHGYDNMWGVVIKAVKSNENQVLKDILNFMVTAGFGVPVFIALCLAIYYYSMLSAANQQMVRVLKDQLVLEGKDKSFLLARLTEVTKLHRLPNK